MSALKAGIKIYTTSFCPYCVRAKQLLKRRGISFEEIRINEEDDSEWDKLYRISGMKTMPQIFQGERLIGGYRELSLLDEKEGLESLRE